MRYQGKRVSAIALAAGLSLSACGGGGGGGNDVGSDSGTSGSTSNSGSLLERDAFSGSISGLSIKGELFQNGTGKCEFHHRITNTTSSGVRAFLVFDFEGPDGYVGSLGGISRTVSAGQTLTLDDITTRIAKRGAGGTPIDCGDITQIELDPRSPIL